MSLRYGSHESMIGSLIFLFGGIIGWIVVIISGIYLIKRSFIEWKNQVIHGKDRFFLTLIFHIVFHIVFPVLWVIYWIFWMLIWFGHLLPDQYHHYRNGYVERFHRNMLFFDCILILPTFIDYEIREYVKRKGGEHKMKLMYSYLIVQKFYQ